MDPVSIYAYLTLAVLLFGIGTTGVLISRNIIVLFMSIELMLNAANLALIAFSRALGVVDGHVFVFLILTVAAAWSLPSFEIANRSISIATAY